MTYQLLAGLRVVESSAFIAAPLGGLALSQLGAEVIRIDAIGGGIDYRRMPLRSGGRSFYWTALNKGKRSIAIDLSHPEGQELVAALATTPGDQGGILLSNIAARWLSHEGLSARRADMITCLIEGNFDGSSTVDYTVNCATGYPAVTGEGSRDRPVNHALPAWDVICAMQAATAVIAAVLGRRTTGQGAELRIALSDVAFATLSHLGLMAEAELGGERESLGNHIYGAFGRDFRTADGERVMVAAISTRQWRSLVHACNLETAIAGIEATIGFDFASEADRFEGRELIAALVKRWFDTRNFDDVARTFDQTGVCWGRYGSIRDLIDRDPRASLKNPIFERISTPGIGEHLSAGCPVRLAGEVRQPTLPAQVLGQDTDAVLAEVLGLNSSQIGVLHDRGVVAGPERDPLLSQPVA